MPDRVFRMNLNLRNAQNYNGSGQNMWWKADYKLPNGNYLPWTDGYTMVKVASLSIRLDLNAAVMGSNDRLLAIRIPQFASDSYDTVTYNGNATLFKWSLMTKLQGATNMDGTQTAGSDYITCETNNDPHNYITVPTSQLNSLNLITVNIVNGVTGTQSLLTGPFFGNAAVGPTVEVPSSADVAVELIFMKADDKF